MDEIQAALQYTTDTKACTIERGAINLAASFIKSLFPSIRRAFQGAISLVAY